MENKEKESEVFPTEFAKVPIMPPTQWRFLQRKLSFQNETIKYVLLC